MDKVYGREIKDDLFLDLLEKLEIINYTFKHLVMFFRHYYPDLVTYDLTKGIDFSDPKSVARIISDVFFEKDALKWFKVKDEKIEFEPTYKVRIVMAEEHNKMLESVVDDFQFFKKI